MRNKLLKLIALANNNPNENEANLAARKVCEILGTNNNLLAEDPSQYNEWFNNQINNIYRAAKVNTNNWTMKQTNFTCPKCGHRFNVNKSTTLIAKCFNCNQSTQLY